jgi:hypothetical protein
MRIGLLGFVSLLAVGCVAQPIAVSATNNEEVPVDTLFVHEGCTMYRFKDGGVFHYYARCDGARPAVQTMSIVSCGKSCVRPDDIATDEVH